MSPSRAPAAPLRSTSSGAFCASTLIGMDDSDHHNPTQPSAAARSTSVTATSTRTRPVRVRATGSGSAGAFIPSERPNPLLAFLRQLRTGTGHARGGWCSIVSGARGYAPATTTASERDPASSEPGEAAWQQRSGAARDYLLATWPRDPRGRSAHERTFAVRRTYGRKSAHFLVSTTTQASAARGSPHCSCKRRARPASSR